MAVFHLSVVETVSCCQHPLVRDERSLASLLAFGLQGRDNNLGLLCLAVFISVVQALPLLPDTLKVTCQGVLSWSEALTDMFPTPQMVSVSLETSMAKTRWRKKWVRATGQGRHHEPPSESPLCSLLQGGQSLLTQHVLKDLLHGLCILQDEGVPLSILLGSKLVQFFPIHIQLAHPNRINVWWEGGKSPEPVTERLPKTWGRYLYSASQQRPG